MGIITDIEKKNEEIKQLSLIDDLFFAVAFEDIDACQELIRVIMDNDTIVVKEVKTQFSIRSIMEHSVQLDLVASDSTHRTYCIELQKRDENNAEYRIRYNQALFDSRLLDKGVDYSELPIMVSIFISDFDVHNSGMPIYHTETRIKENGQLYEDGRHIIYVNATNDDGSTVSRLMKEFKNQGKISEEFTCIANRVKYLKQNEGGQRSMHPIIERIYGEEIAQLKEEMQREMQKEKEMQEEFAKQVEKEREVTVKRLLEKKISVEDIMYATSCSQEEVLRVMEDTEIYG